MMMSIPNGKLLTYQERNTLQSFLDSPHPIKVVSRRDSIELHVQEVENKCMDEAAPEISSPPPLSQCVGDGPMPS